MEATLPLLNSAPVPEAERLRAEVRDLRQQLAISRHHAACLRESLLSVDTDMARVLLELEHVRAQVRRVAK
jgi:hypothetical protein